MCLFIVRYLEVLLTDSEIILIPTKVTMVLYLWVHNENCHRNLMNENSVTLRKQTSYSANTLVHTIVDRLVAILNVIALVKLYHNLIVVYWRVTFVLAQQAVLL